MPFCVAGEPVLLDDTSIPAFYFDGLTNFELRAGVLRMVAFVERVNPISGLVERLPVAVLLRPATITAQIRAGVDRAMCARDRHVVLSQFQ